MTDLEGNNIVVQRNQVIVCGKKGKDELRKLQEMTLLDVENDINKRIFVLHINKK